MSFDILSRKMSLEDKGSTMQHVVINEPNKDLSDDEIYETNVTEPFAIRREPHPEKIITKVSIIDEGYDEDLMKELNSDDSVSQISTHSTDSSRRNVDFSLQNDFFDGLGEIPDLDDVSLDVSVEEVEEVIQEVDTGVAADSGKFVDPLTGEMESSEEVAEPEPVAPEEEEQEEEEDEDFEFDLGLPPDVEEDEQLGDKATAQEDDAFEALIAMETEKEVVVVEEVDFEALERENAARQLLESTNEFLQEIITSVVDTCEYIDPNSILRQNLDKEKLMRELIFKLDDLDIEQKARHFLNRKTVDYFRRKKIFRCIAEDNQATVKQDIEKFKLATAQLDYMLGKQEETMRVTELRIFSLETEARSMEEKARVTLNIFEDRIRKALHRETFDKLNASVESQLEKMSLLRKDITKVRTMLIQKQHTLATLMVKLDKLENLGNGLKMRDFENMQTETQALGKKIEERNVELNKLRIRCNADLHIMAHMKMKQQMLSNTIAIQETAMQELIFEKKNCREYLYDLKISRGRIRKEIQDMSFQGGLLDKPALMLDYDETVERLEQLRAKVQQSRNKFADMQHRIHTAEGKCDEDVF